MGVITHLLTIDPNFLGHPRRWLRLSIGLLSIWSSQPKTTNITKERTPLTPFYGNLSRPGQGLTINHHDPLRTPKNKAEHFLGGGNWEGPVGPYRFPWWHVQCEGWRQWRERNQTPKNPATSSGKDDTDRILLWGWDWNPKSIAKIYSQLAQWYKKDDWWETIILLTEELRLTSWRVVHPFNSIVNNVLYILNNEWRFLPSRVSLPVPKSLLLSSAVGWCDFANWKFSPTVLFLDIWTLNLREGITGTPNYT